MPVQYTPQQLLDQIHETKYAELDWSDMPTKERIATIKVVRQKLKLVKQSLRTEEDAIKRRWDGRKAHEAERERVELLPYSGIIGRAIEIVEAYFVELDTASKFDKPLPSKPVFGKVIIGGEEFDNAWEIVDNQEAADTWRRKQWEKQQLTNKLISIRNKQIELVEQELQIKQGIQTLKSTATDVQAKIKTAQSWSFWSFLKALAIGLIFVASGGVTIAATFYLSDGKKLNTNLTTLLVFGGIGVVMGVLVLFRIFQYAAFGRNAEIKNGGVEIMSLRKKHREYKNALDTIAKEMAALESEYSSSKLAFEALSD